MPAIAKALTFVRANALQFVTEALINFLLPYVIFNLAQRRYGEFDALIASSAPPIIWSVFEFVRHRRVDALSMLVLGGIILSLLAMLGGGSVKFLQLREKLVTVIIGAIFVGSSIIGKPLIYELACAGMKRKNSSDDLARFESLRDDSYFRGSMTIMTLVWGFGLLADAGISIILAYVLSVREYLIVGPIVGYATMGSLALWTFWFARVRRREGDRRRALAAQHPGAETT